MILALQFGKALLGSKAFRYVMAGFLAIASWSIWLARHDAKVEKAAVTQIDTGAKKLTAEAVKAAAAAQQPGSIERLRKRWCVDCNEGKK